MPDFFVSWRLCVFVSLCLCVFVSNDIAFKNAEVMKKDAEPPKPVWPLTPYSFGNALRISEISRGLWRRGGFLSDFGELRTALYGFLWKTARIAPWAG